MEIRRIPEHLRWHVRMDSDLRRTGLPRGAFLRSYCRARLRPFGQRTTPVVDRFAVRHGVSGQKSTLHLRTAPGDISDWIVLRGVWAYQDYFHPMIRRCRTILDVGANAGIAAVWFKALLPEAELACVEPDPRNLPLARLNLVENGISAKIFECAVAPYAGRTRLGIEAWNGKSSLEDAGLYAHRDFVEVETRRIPEILDDLGWGHVDLIKMDIEGMERDILADGADWLDRVGLIVLELHQNTTPKELSSLLDRCDWTIQRLNVDDEETYLAMPRRQSKEYSNFTVIRE
jgi:FkbM family methyltransferase